MGSYPSGCLAQIDAVLTITPPPRMRHGEADSHAAASDHRPLAPELEIHVLLPRALACAERTSTRPESRSGKQHRPLDLSSRSKHRGHRGLVSPCPRLE